MGNGREWPAASHGLPQDSANAVCPVQGVCYTLSRAAVTTAERKGDESEGTKRETRMVDWSGKRTDPKFRGDSVLACGPRPLLSYKTMAPGEGLPWNRLLTEQRIPHLLRDHTEFPTDAFLSIVRLPPLSLQPHSQDSLRHPFHLPCKFLAFSMLHPYL